MEAGTDAADVRLVYLGAMTVPKSLDVRGTKVTNTRIAELQKALPKVEVLPRPEPAAPSDA